MEPYEGFFARAELVGELANLKSREAILDFFLNEPFDKSEAFPKYLRHLWEVIRRRSQILTRACLRAQRDELCWGRQCLLQTMEKLLAYIDAAKKENKKEQEATRRILREDPVFARYAKLFDEKWELPSILEYVTPHLAGAMLWWLVRIELLDIAIVFRNQGAPMPPWQPREERNAIVKKVYLENVDEVRSRDWYTTLTYDCEEASRNESFLEIVKRKYEGATQYYERKGDIKAKPELLERAQRIEYYLRCLWVYEEVPESEVEHRRRAAEQIYSLTQGWLDLRNADFRLLRKMETIYLSKINDLGMSWALPHIIQDRIDRFEPLEPWDDLIQDSNDEDAESPEERREEIRIILPELFSILGITAQPDENGKGHIDSPAGEETSDGAPATSKERLEPERVEGANGEPVDEPGQKKKNPRHATLEKVIIVSEIWYQSLAGKLSPIHDVEDLRQLLSEYLYWRNPEKKKVKDTLRAVEQYVGYNTGRGSGDVRALIINIDEHLPEVKAELSRLGSKVVSNLEGVVQRWCETR